MGPVCYGPVEHAVDGAHERRPRFVEKHDDNRGARQLGKVVVELFALRVAEWRGEGGEGKNEQGKEKGKRVRRARASKRVAADTRGSGAPKVGDVAIELDGVAQADVEAVADQRAACILIFRLVNGLKRRTGRECCVPCLKRRQKKRRIAMRRRQTLG